MSGLELTEDQRIERAVKCVRLFIRDLTQSNRLLLGEFESTDDEIKLAVFMALDDWNTTPPPASPVSLANHPAKHLLIEGAAIRTIRGAYMWHAREHMPSTDGGTSADDHAKSADYAAWADRAEQVYEQKKTDYKLQQNIAVALGNMQAPSEYSFYFIYGEELAF